MRFLATVKGITGVAWDQEVPQLGAPDSGITPELGRMLESLVNDAQRQLPMMVIQQKKLPIPEVQKRGGPFTCVGCGAGTMLCVSHPGFHPAAPGGAMWTAQMVPTCEQEACQKAAEDHFFAANAKKGDNAATPAQKCGACGAPAAALPCETCRAVRYCNPACLAAHAGAHKPTCKAA